MLLDGLNNDKKGWKRERTKSRNFHWPCEETFHSRKKIMEMEIYFLLLIANCNCTLRTSALHASPGKVGKLRSRVTFEWRPLKARKGNFHVKVQAAFSIQRKPCRSIVKNLLIAKICTSHICPERRVSDMPVCACEMRRFRKNETWTEILNFQFQCPAKSFLLEDFVLLFCKVFFVDLYYASLRWKRIKGNWI